MANVSYSVKLLREFIRFARAKKEYWIIPLVIVLAFIGLMIVVGQGGAPLIYTLF